MAYRKRSRGSELQWSELLRKSVLIQVWGTGDDKNENVLKIFSAMKNVSYTLILFERFQ